MIFWIGGLHASQQHANPFAANVLLSSIKAKECAMRLTRSINPLSVLLQRAILRRLSPLLVTLLLASMLVQDALADEQTSAAVSAASATSVTSTSAATSTDAEAAAKQDKKRCAVPDCSAGLLARRCWGHPQGGWLDWCSGVLTSSCWAELSGHCDHSE